MKIEVLYEDNDILVAVSRTDCHHSRIRRILKIWSVC